ncbi:sulfur carrier protein ThiS [Roseburia hominis]
MIHLTVNGSPIQLEAPTTVTDYLTAHGYALTRIAVELNGAILSKANYATTFLTEADTMEVVTFVGGG